MLARVSVALVALVLLAWLGVMERDARLQARGAAALRPGSPRAGSRAPRRTCGAPGC